MRRPPLITRALAALPATLCVALVSLACSSSGSGPGADQSPAGDIFTSPAIAIDTDAGSQTVEQQMTYTLDTEAAVSIVLTEPLDYVAYRLELQWDPSVLSLERLVAPPDAAVTCEEVAVAAADSSAALQCSTAGDIDDSLILASAAFTCLSPGVSVVRLVPAQDDGTGTSVDVLPEDAARVAEFAIVSGVISCDAG